MAKNPAKGIVLNIFFLNILKPNTIIKVAKRVTIKNNKNEYVEKNRLIKKRK